MAEKQLAIYIVNGLDRNIVHALAKVIMGHNELHLQASNGSCIVRVRFNNGRGLVPFCHSVLNQPWWGEDEGGPTWKVNPDSEALQQTQTVKWELIRWAACKDLGQVLTGEVAISSIAHLIF